MTEDTEITLKLFALLDVISFGTYFCLYDKRKKSPIFGVLNILEPKSFRLQKEINSSKLLLPVTSVRLVIQLMLEVIKMQIPFIQC